MAAEVSGNKVHCEHVVPPDALSEIEFRNAIIDSGDDAICFKSTSPKPTTDIEVYDCKLKSHCGAIKFGTESMGDFKNITVRDCFVHDTKGGGIKILSADGANVDMGNYDHDQNQRDDRVPRRCILHLRNRRQLGW